MQGCVSAEHLKQIKCRQNQTLQTFSLFYLFFLFVKTVFSFLGDSKPANDYSASSCLLLGAAPQQHQLPGFLHDHLRARLHHPADLQLRGDVLRHRLGKAYRFIFSFCGQRGATPKTFVIFFYITTVPGLLPSICTLILTFYL